MSLSAAERPSLRNRLELIFIEGTVCTGERRFLVNEDPFSHFIFTLHTNRGTRNLFLAARPKIELGMCAVVVM